MGPAPAFALRMHSMLLLFRRAGCAATRQTCCGLLVASHIQPARQPPDVAPHRVPQRSCVGRRHAEKPRPDVVDGIGAVHVLAPNHLNLIVELFSCEQHAKQTHRPYQKRRGRFQKATVGTAVQDADAKVTRQCCQGLAALPLVFKVSNHRFSGHRYASMSRISRSS